MRAAGAEERKAQEQMALSVFDTLEAQGHSCIEAPTGMGKAIAYLIPTMLWSIKNKQTVAISTATKMLQDQIVATKNADAPYVVKHIEKVTGIAPVFSVLKGRNNYVSQDRYRDFVLFALGKDLDNPEVSRISKWAEETEDGDLASAPDLPEDMPASSICIPEWGGWDDSFYRKALEKARAANVVITNHHAILSRFRVFLEKDQDRIPAFEGVGIRNIVFDEAHQLEQIAHSLFTRQISLHELKTCMKALVNYAHRQKAGLNMKHAGETYVDLITADVKRIDATMDHLKTLRPAGDLALIGNGARTGKGRAVDPKPILSALNSLASAIDRSLEFAEKLATAERRRNGGDKAEASETSKGAGIGVVLDTQSMILAHKKEIDRISTGISSGSSMGFLTFSEVYGYPSVVLASNNVATFLSNRWCMFDALVFTSATISIPSKSKDDTWGYFMNGVGLSKGRWFKPKTFEYTVCPSPFTFEDVQVFLPATDVPAPNETAKKDRDRYNEYLVQMIEDACVTDTDGGIMVLCTSYTDITEISRRLKEPVITLGKRTVITHRKGIKAGDLKRQFVEQPHKNILLATGVFWTGVDLPDKELTTLIISRLPFDNITDPISMSRSFGRETNTVFRLVTLPGAVMKFRQGTGRLVRKKTDMGKIYIADSRVHKHTQFLLALQHIKNQQQFGEVRNPQQRKEA
jgi:ATP-dependent DNA helicase DinG